MTPINPDLERLTFTLIMEFDYNGKHYSYHGRKLENAVARLTAPGGPQPRGTSAQRTAELVVWGNACHDWKRVTGKLPD